MSAAPHRVFVLGLPRSGSSWTSEVLAHTQGVLRVYEPDNHATFPYALRAKRQLGTFPYLEAGDDAPGYERLWRLAFQGAGGVGNPYGLRSKVAWRLLGSMSRPGPGPFAPRDAFVTAGWRAPLPVWIAGTVLASRPKVPPPPQVALVKSVHAVLSLPWVVERFQPRVLVIERNPLNVISSWLRLNLDEMGRIDERALARFGWGPQPSRDAPLVERVAWRVGFLTAALAELATECPEAVVTSHERLCVDPSERMRMTAKALGLTWTEEAARFVDEANRPGENYETRRVASQLPQQWRERLSDDELECCMNVLQRFPLGDVLGQAYA